MGANCAHVKEEAVQEIVDASDESNSSGTSSLTLRSFTKERDINFEAELERVCSNAFSIGTQELHVPEEFLHRDDTPPAPCVREEYSMPCEMPQEEDEKSTPRMVYQELQYGETLDGMHPSKTQLDGGRFEEPQKQLDGLCPSAEVTSVPYAGQAEQMLHFEQLPLSEVKPGRTICITNKSSVFLANWRGSEVVLKTIKADLKTKDDSDSREVLEISRKEMIHEINILTKMRHPNVISILGGNIDQESPFFITEYFGGGDVESYLHRQRQRTGGIYRTPLRLAMQWATSFAEALTYIHGLQRPVIHRDLKPMNLLLTSNLTLKVADFGIAKVMQSRVSQTPAPKMSGGVGTWRYMAPEVVRFQQYTDRIDVYAFGLIVYLILTGRQPFDDFAKNDPELILKAYLRGEEPRPTVSSSTGTPELCQLMQDAWHVNAAARPSAEECASRLVQMAAEQSAKKAKGNGILTSLKKKITGRG